MLWLMIGTSLLAAPGPGRAEAMPRAASARVNTRPWLDPSLPPARRAVLAPAAMEQDEKLRLVFGQLRVAAIG